MIKNEQERAEFFEAGIDLPKGRMIHDREVVRFEIAEDDPRYESFARILRKQAVDDWNACAMGESRTISVESKFSRGAKLEWLDGYSGQTVDELLALEGKCRIDSLVLAFEQGIQRKGERNGRESLTNEEHMVLAVEALEREVNNGGYDLFLESSSEFAPTVVGSLQRIGCEKIATITQTAIEALGISEITAQAIDAAMAVEDERRSAELSRCNDAYYNSSEPVAERLFAFIKMNKPNITL